MKKLKLDDITLDLAKEMDDVRVILPTRSVLLREQSIREIVPVIEHNYAQIVSYYRSKLVDDLNSSIDQEDISRVSVSILLYYLSMSNKSRIGRRKFNRDTDLHFQEGDFSLPPTYDIIIRYFRASYPESWEEKCAILLGISVEELKNYYKEREKYYNK